MGLFFWLGGCGEDVFAEHGGSLRAYRAQLLLLPRRGIGVFVAFNAGHADESLVMNAFLDRYFPDRCTSGPPDASAVSAPSAQPLGVSEIVGVYGGIRFSRTSPFYLRVLVDSGRVVARGDDAIEYLGERWTRAGQSAAFEGAALKDRVMFIRGTGDETYLIRASQPPNPRLRLAWYAAPRFHQFSFIAAVAAWLAGLGVTLASAVQARRARAAGRAAPAADGLLLLALAGALGIASVVFLVLRISQFYYFGPGLALRLAALGPLVAVGLAAAGLVRSRAARGAARTALVLLVAAIGMLIWQVSFWHLWPWNVW